MNPVFIIASNVFIVALILLYTKVNLASRILLTLSLSVVHTNLFGDFGILHIWVVVCLMLLCLRKLPATLLMLISAYAVITYIQYLLFDDSVRSYEYLDWSRKLPLAFAFLILYLYVSWDFVSNNPKLINLINYLCVYLVIVTPFSAIILNGSVIDENFDLWQDNGNDTSLIISVAWLHFMFHNTKVHRIFSNLPFILFLTICAISVTVMASSRWSTIFIVGFFAWWLLTTGHGLRLKKATLAFFLTLSGMITSVVIMLSWSSISGVLTGSFFQFAMNPDELGVNLNLIWNGYHGYAPLVSSVSYRLNGVLVAIGSTFQTFGIGVGTGRAVAVNEMVSGYAGSLHVVVAELLLELGVVFPTVSWMIVQSKLRRDGVSLVSAATVAVTFAMMAQSSGYLTHYLTWIIIVSIAFHHRTSDISARDSSARKNSTAIPQSKYAIV